MVTWSLDSLKKSSKKKEMGIEKKNNRVVTTSYWPQEKERKVKDRNDEIPGFDLVPTYWLD